jgi:hypothetical protein
MYSNKKDQIKLEDIYSNLNATDKKQLNEGISGIYPEEANNFGAMIFHILLFALPVVLHKLKLSMDEGKLKVIKDKIVNFVTSDKSSKTLKDKIIDATKDVIYSEYEQNSTINKNLSFNIEKLLNFIIPKNIETKNTDEVSNYMKKIQMGISDPVKRVRL